MLAMLELIADVFKNCSRVCSLLIGCMIVIASVNVVVSVSAVVSIICCTETWGASWKNLHVRPNVLLSTLDALLSILHSHLSSFKSRLSHLTAKVSDHSLTLKSLISNLNS